MVLEYSGHRYAVDESHAILHIGRRKKGCELVLQNEKTSRMHATIEQRRDQFVLVDTSINGTFVQYEGEPERMVRHEELPLRASGTLSCGETHRANTAEVIRFYVT
jgi:predicted component of type VI protein secretion system